MSEQYSVTGWVTLAAYPNRSATPVGNRRERKLLPLKDVAAAGGWKDVGTLLEVYQQSDEESVLAVASVTLKLRDRGVA